MVNRFLLSALLTLFVSSLTIQSFANSNETSLLPKSVLGKYHGTLVWGKNVKLPKVSQETTATITQSGKLVSIIFSGGTPGPDSDTPKINNFQFKMALGTQTGRFESVNAESSQEGIHISSFLSNMTVENLYIGGVRVEFTGVKSQM